MQNRKLLTIEQAAEWLSANAEALYTRDDVLMLIGNGTLPLSWLLHDVHVQDVSYASGLYGGFVGPYHLPLGGQPMYWPGERKTLFGYARLPRIHNPQLQEWAFAAILNKSPISRPEHGVILEGNDGELYQAIEAWGKDYSPMPKLEPVPLTEWVIQARDLQAFHERADAMSGHRIPAVTTGRVPDNDMHALADTFIEVPAHKIGIPAPVVPVVALGSAKSKRTKRRTWLDVSETYLVDTFKAEQCPTAKDFFKILERKAGPDSPFERDTRTHGLFVREVGVRVSFKMIQTAVTAIRKDS